MVSKSKGINKFNCNLYYCRTDGEDRSERFMNRMLDYVGEKE